MGTSLNMKSLPLSDFWAKVAFGLSFNPLGGALSSGSTVSLSSICPRFAFLRFLRWSLPSRWSKYWRSPFNINLLCQTSCGLSCCSSELAAAPLSLVLDAVGRRKRLCRGQGGQGGLPFFLLGFWVSCCSLGGPFLKHQDEGKTIEHLPPRALNPTPLCGSRFNPHPTCCRNYLQ